MHTQLTRKLPVRQHAVIDETVIWIAGTGDDARAFIWGGPGTGLQDSTDAETFRDLNVGTFNSASTARRTVVSLAVAAR